MNTGNYTTTIVVKQKPNSVFQAIKNFRDWWSEDIEGNTDRLGETFLYHFKDIHLCKIKLIEEVPNEKLVYKIIDNHFSFTKDKAEWVDTKLIFEIDENSKQTKIKFTHDGLTPKDECFEVCNDAWGNYINKSLYNLISTGKGEPNPKEKDGFNADIVKKWKLK
ncbi:SRPBCC domain-containing protein [Arenibacter sp. M-2]|uniref:SRPBCC domain-containing protein n=1 Tax=Arenibacter sp. M-2 TaxID=3053612 RepID=UPI0025707569|nr:SRPBCC domain-containing protein [Arenibacter sp. M-2]MDL5511155.1 SRPBCC domain-containing protein [Arenibacter sp. M-2]